MEGMKGTGREEKKLWREKEEVQGSSRREKGERGSVKGKEEVKGREERREREGKGGGGEGRRGREWRNGGKKDKGTEERGKVRQE